MADTRKIDSMLLIDDDDIVNFLNTTIIRMTHRVEEIQSVTSGNAAINKLNELYAAGRWPSIICIDINMPGINGWELIDLFKQYFQPMKNKSIVCLLSSSLDPRDQAKAEASDWVDYYVSKPLTANALNNLYNKVFN
jgi:CheY-like chemotaxis protein